MSLRSRVTSADSHIPATRQILQVTLTRHPVRRRNQEAVIRPVPNNDSHPQTRVLAPKSPKCLGKQQGCIHPAAIDVPFRKPDEDVRRTRVRGDLVRVKMLVWTAGILKPFRFAPIQKIGGRGRLDTANSTAAWRAIVEVTEIGPVFSAKRIPER